jgi:hypothetical protein
VSDDNTEGCFAALVILFVGLPLSSALYAWAAELNWNWFATTIGAPRIGFLQAYGLSLVWSAYTSSYSHKKDDRKVGEIAAILLGYTVLRFLILAGFGYAVHAWMVG